MYVGLVSFLDVEIMIVFYICIYNDGNGMVINYCIGIVGSYVLYWENVFFLMFFD